MILDHVRVFTEDKKFTDGGIVIKDGRIAEVFSWTYFYRKPRYHNPYLKYADVYKAGWTSASK